MKTKTNLIHGVCICGNLVECSEGLCLDCLDAQRCQIEDSQSLIRCLIATAARVVVILAIFLTALVFFTSTARPDEFTDRIAALERLTASAPRKDEKKRECNCGTTPRTYHSMCPLEGACSSGGVSCGLAQCGVNAEPEYWWHLDESDGGYYLKRAGITIGYCLPDGSYWSYESQKWTRSPRRLPSMYAPVQYRPMMVGSCGAGG